MYTHVSDVLYFGGLRPDSTGNITYASSTYQNALATLRSQAATSGFKLHLSMFEVTGGQTDTTWESIIASPTYRQTFVTQLKNIMLGSDGMADDIHGFNFDWERPNTATEWGNYTQLARELRAAFDNPATPTTNNWEVSVCDYGSTDTKWDDTSLFDAKVYDQLFVMSYHLSASSTGTYTNQKLALTGQGAAKAFSNDQIAVGVGTWGDNGPSTVGLSAIVAANPNLAYDALTYTGTIGSATGTWTIESRKQVREKTQLALDRGMPGMFTWTLHYDATNNLGLHRVMQHYAMVKRDVPDLNLDGKMNASDATTLANNMGTTRTNTGMATAAQFDAFYLAANWENGDHDGNGFVNQADADWLAGRYAALGVTLPDRLAYSGTFESFANSAGLVGRWRAGRDAQNKLVETGSFKQETTNYLSWSGAGVGASRRSNSFVTIRNQNAAEAAAGVNNSTRVMQADLAANMDLDQSQATYITFLVRENTGSLTATQLASANRVLTLDFLNNVGNAEFQFNFLGRDQLFNIESLIDAGGQDTTGGGLTANSTYLFVGKISGNGPGANTMQASVFPTGAVVGNFTDPTFSWMLTAASSEGYNPQITGLRFLTRAEANYTIGNVWIGDAATMLPATLTSQGDFNHDGTVDGADFVTWRNSLGQAGANLAADGNGNYLVDADDLFTWRGHFGQAAAIGAGDWDLVAAVPESTSGALLTIGFLSSWTFRRRIDR
jgi:hypothetical protein